MQTAKRENPVSFARLSRQSIRESTADRGYVGPVRKVQGSYDVMATKLAQTLPAPLGSRHAEQVERLVKMLAAQHAKRQLTLVSREKLMERLRTFKGKGKYGDEMRRRMNKHLAEFETFLTNVQTNIDSKESEINDLLENHSTTERAIALNFNHIKNGIDAHTGTLKRSKLFNISLASLNLDYQPF